MTAIQPARSKMSTVPCEGQFSFANQKLGWAVARDGKEIALVQTKDGARSWALLDPTVVR